MWSGENMEIESVGWKCGKGMRNEDQGIKEQN
jgi:hypothetical protein